MARNKRQQRFHRFLAGLLVCAMVIANSAFIPTKSVAAAVKTPEISSSSKDLLVGREYGLSVDNKVKNSTYKWNSSDTSIAVVDRAGLVKGLKKGKATVICTVTTPTKIYQLKSQVTIRVPAKSILISNKIDELKVGDTYDLNRTISPKSSNDRTYWKSSDNTIAKPNKNGKFTALKKGTVTITAKTLSGKSNSITIKVISDKNTKTLTSKDVKDGNITLSNKTYDILSIEKSVGNAEIILENVKITDSLIMETDADYTVRAIDSDIAKVVTLEEQSQIVSMAVGDTQAVAPTFIAEKGTLVITLDARGNVSIKQDGEARIGTITVNRSIDGNISLSLEGFNGNLVVNNSSNADIAIETKNCMIKETTISGTSSGQKLTLTDNTANGAVSSLGKITVETNARLSIDVPATEVVISEKVKNADVTLEKPVDKVTNEGASSKLAINSNVNNVISKGEELNLKVAAGSSIKAVEMSGRLSKIDVALGSQIQSVVSKGDNSEIVGNGSVVGAKIEGNNTKINTSDTKVEVSSTATGTSKNGTELLAGATATPIPAQTPSSGSSTPSTPVVPTQITIADPGIIYAGTNVLLKTDNTEVSWSVYEYIDQSNGYAEINQSSGELQPLQTGTVRVVARSKQNSKIYGAVDLKIQGKRFVRIEPLEPVTITADEGLNEFIDLKTSGKLPTKVKLVYETGVGNQTEIIEVNLSENRWYGQYDGTIIGNNMLKCGLEVPTGYEHPDFFNACVVVQVNAIQSDNRVAVSGYESVNTINLTTNENCVETWELYEKYLDKKQITLHLADGTDKIVETDGYGVVNGIRFDGAALGSYTVNLYITLPKGTVYKNKQMTSNYVKYIYDTYITIPVTVNVQTIQTSETVDVEGIPDTTQAKFVYAKTDAVIQSVSLAGSPTIWPVGEILNMKQYLTVSTDSSLESDKRVIWSWSGDTDENSLDVNEGKIVLSHMGLITVRATSVIDNSKYCEVALSLENTNPISSFEPLVPIVVNTDKGIYNFTTLINALESELPKTITGTRSSGEKVVYPVYVWRLTKTEGNVFTLQVHIKDIYAYLMPSLPNLKVELVAAQTDNRITVVSGSAIQTTVTLSEDKNATTEAYLMKELYQFENNNTKIPINVQLSDGSIVQVLGTVLDYFTSCANPSMHYRSEVGSYQLNYNVLLPDNYRLNGTNPNDKLSIIVDVTITQEQTLRLVLVRAM